MMTRLLPWALAALLAGCSRQGATRERDTEAGTDAATTAATDPSEASVPLPPTPPTMPAEATTPGRAVMSFAMDVHRTWRADEARRRTTAALSPLSIAGALALLHAGARGETRDELAHALHLSAGVAAADLLKLETRAAPGFEVSRGQRVFADRSLAVTPEYRHAVGAAFASLDFRNHENARGEINRWTKTATRGHISELLGPGSIGDETRLVLVDALFAAARWATPFDPARTHPESFTTLGGTLESIPMMVANTSTQRFARAKAYDAIDLACADAEHALLIIAPTPGHFDEVDASLDLDGFDRIVASLGPGMVIVSMPRFRAALPATSLTSELHALGISQAFDEHANLEGITRERDVHVDDVLHAATIDVDESGARAAAATAVVIVPPPAPLPSITVNRPFLFWLRNIRTGTPIVMGRFMGVGG